MSGPKTSRYRLTPEQQKILMEQLRKAREEQLRKERLAQEKEKLTAIVSKVQILSTEIKLTCESVDISDEFEPIINKLERELDEIERLDSSENLLLIKEKQKIMQGFASELSSFTVKIGQIIDEKNNEEKEKFENRINVGFQTAFDYARIEKKQDLKEDKIYKEMLFFFENSSGIILPLYLKKRVDDVIKQLNNLINKDYLDNFYTITFCPLVKEYEQYMTDYDLHSEDYYSLFAQYKVLLKQCDENFDASLEDFSMDNLHKLKEIVDMLEKQRLDVQEQEYISRCLDEAMDEMGYQRVGKRSVIKKSGRQFVHKLYQIKEGTAVDVTYADNGQVTMEIGAIDNCDRSPSAEEAYHLTAEMNEFCTHYKELEELLRQKGIVRNNISILPPSVEYAEVINVSEYELTRELDKYKVSRHLEQKQNVKYLED